MHIGAYAFPGKGDRDTENCVWNWQQALLYYDCIMCSATLCPEAPAEENSPGLRRR